jgi:hydroxypyruvate isomerase
MNNGGNWRIPVRRSAVDLGHRPTNARTAMISFSANLGFLWTDQPLPDAIRSAGAAGFDAVECHMPYPFATDDVGSALIETGLTMTSINTRLGDGQHEVGVAAVPGEETRARTYIDQAIAYADAIGCANVSVLAGRTGRGPGCEDAYRSNLAYAATAAAPLGIGVLIEPLNTQFAPDYHLTTVEQGMETIDAIGYDNVKLMVDCFHTHLMEGDLYPRFELAMPYVGHVQISAYPDRGEPVGGEIDYHTLLPALIELGYPGLFGAEYTPRAGIDVGLDWLATWHAQRGGSSS